MNSSHCLFPNQLIPNNYFLQSLINREVYGVSGLKYLSTNFWNGFCINQDAVYADLRKFGIFSYFRQAGPALSVLSMICVYLLFHSGLF
jgi:hypothetical protein